METKDQLAVNQLKTAVEICCSVAFLFASAAVACTARHYQVSGQPMPNGKGGFMTFSDGYLIAAVFFLFSVAGFIAAWKSLKARSNPLR